MSGLRLSEKHASNRGAPVPQGRQACARSRRLAFGQHLERVGPGDRDRHRRPFSPGPLPRHMPHEQDERLDYYNERQCHQCSSGRERQVAGHAAHRRMQQAASRLPRVRIDEVCFGRRQSWGCGSDCFALRLLAGHFLQTFSTGYFLTV